MEQIVRQVIDMGVTLITISGGEPFLRERADRTITRLAGRFNNRGFLVYTNGTLIDRADRPAAWPGGQRVPGHQRGGLRAPDRRPPWPRRVPGRTARVRQLLAEQHVMAGFSATVTRENAEAICTDAFLDMRIEEGDLFGWFFLLQPIGRQPRPDLMLTADQRALLRETITRWRQQNRPIFLGDFWNDGHLTGGCIAGGRYYFHIYANGDISPCVFSPVACGNIFDIIRGTSPYASLNDFVQRHPVFVAYRSEQNRVSDRHRPCLLLDHPAAFRRVCRVEGCSPARNMPPGYLDGPIAQALDAASADWARAAETLPAHPAERQAAREAILPLP